MLRRKIYQEVLDRLFLQCDMQFHREITTIAGNPICPAIVEALVNWASAYHQTIAARDPVAAEQAMRDHLTRASVLYQSPSGA
ncbi:hypothetical protein [Hydrogenophaga sp. OTU3427]|uniref:hypothetical protein n=1 Tax=Hydrogenophaga sp. OTU3427 TaxID=3043856 RepID=UPI00313B99E7